MDTLMIEELLKGEVVLFIEKKDGTIVIAGSQLGALAITADGDTGNYRRFKRVYCYFSNYSGFRHYLQGTYRYATALMPYVIFIINK
jgi:hypothetical protein